MPRQPEPVVFALGPEVDGESVVRWVRGATPAGPPRASERVLMDTFDGRLGRRHLTLWREGRAGTFLIRLEEPGVATISAPLEARDPDRLLVADLPVGMVGERLRDVIDERALIPRARVRVRAQPFRVCDGEGKTVVRLSVEAPAVLRRGADPLVLGRRLTVAPVLGYDSQMDRVVAVLGRRLQAAERPLPEEALAAAGLSPRGVSSDVDVRIEPGMRADQASIAICRRLVEVVDANRPGALADIDPEFLHDLRVAVRRTRSVLKEMRGVLPPEEGARARDDLKWVQEITGPTRDLDVLLHEWPSMIEPVPDAMTADLQPLAELLERQREEAFGAMRRHLKSRRFAAAWESWRSVLARSGFDGPEADRPIGELAGGRIRSVYRSMQKMGAAIGDSSPATDLHELRKRGKELRYLLELFGPMWPATKVRPLVGTLKGLQDVLGHFQDDEIQVHELRSLGPALAVAPGGTDSLIALGFVIEELTARQRHARDDFGRRFADFAGSQTRRTVEETFR